jgi:hypothetical protein
MHLQYQGAIYPILQQKAGYSVLNAIPAFEILQLLVTFSG